ncbi:hypothetical protein CBS101457_005955 [Exobasidium rhododendri]|nr:hypothetical protein CBS101457_005955 [Exobasidium rhododendri]
MTSLADELDLDPAFDDGKFSNFGGGGPVSYDEEDSRDGSIDTTPPRGSRRGRGRRVGRRGRGIGSAYASDEEGELEPLTLGGPSEGFSLADELEGGDKISDQEKEKSSAGEFDGNDEGNVADVEHLERADVLGDETKARKDQEYYLVSSETLNDSLRLTDSFLKKLKVASVGKNAEAIDLPLPSSKSRSGHFVMETPSNDALTLEERAGKVLKQMQDYSSVREDQIRELQDCDRMLRRAFDEGGDWINALANVDDVESGDNEEGNSTADGDIDLSFISSMTSPKRPSIVDVDTTGNRRFLLEEEKELDARHSFARLPLSPISVNDRQYRDTAPIPINESFKSSSVCQQLSSLQGSTSDLVLSLTSIHEQSQVARVSLNDAARRIRSIKTVLTNWNAEMQAVEESQAHISLWESARGSEARPDDIQEWTRNHMDKFARILHDADIRAKELLSPHS